MQNYLLTVMVKPSVEEKKRGDLLESIKKQFGALTKEDLWGNRTLAYPIAHQDKAYYAHFEFQSEPNKIAPLDKMVKLNEDIMRYLLVKKEERKKPRKAKSAKKQVVSEKKEEVEEKE